MPEPLDLDAIEARANDATEGPWNSTEATDADVHLLVAEADEGHAVPLLARIGHRGNAEFVAATRTDVPALVAEVRRLRAIADAAEHVHRVLHGLIAADATPGVRARSAWDALDTALIAYRSAAPAS